MNIRSSLLVLTFLSTCCHAHDHSTTKDASPTEEKTPKSEAISLFDGKTLEGWKVVNPKNAKFWSVVDGTIVASSGDQKMPINTYLASSQDFEDFEFTCEFRLSGDQSTGLINSGIQYRSYMGKKGKSPKLRLTGYQADIGKGWWGGIYDEHRRGKLVKGDSSKLFADGTFKDDAWHRYKIVCKGNQHRLFINGILTAEYTEKNEKIPAKGFIALQLHKGGVCKIEYKNIQLKKL